MSMCIFLCMFVTFHKPIFFTNLFLFRFTAAPIPVHHLHSDNLEHPWPPYVLRCKFSNGPWPDAVTWQCWLELSDCMVGVSHYPPWWQLYNSSNTQHKWTCLYGDAPYWNTWLCIYRYVWKMSSHSWWKVIYKMPKLRKMQFHGFYFPLGMVRRDKAGIKWTLPLSIVMWKTWEVCWLSSVHLRRALHRPLVLWGMLSRAPMAPMMNRSFNRDRCCPFSLNNGPVLQWDCDVDYIMASDVLYIGKQQGTRCFHPSSVTSMQRSSSWELTPIGSFWNKAWGARLQLTQ